MNYMKKPNRKRECRFSVRLTEEEKDQLEYLANKRQVSKTELIVSMIEDYIQEGKNEETKQKK